MIIFLNGISSSGKSTLARALQHLSKKPLLTIGIDTFFQMMPLEYIDSGPHADQGFHVVPVANASGPRVRVEAGVFAQSVVNSIPHVIRALADNHLDVIVDEVLELDDMLKRYVQALKGVKVYFIGVMCDLMIVEEREILRGNRALGLARDQVDRVHGPTRVYDITVQTTTGSIFKTAHQVLDFISKNPHPAGFKKMEKLFKI